MKSEPRGKLGLRVPSLLASIIGTLGIRAF